MLHMLVLRDKCTIFSTYVEMHEMAMMAGQAFSLAVKMHTSHIIIPGLNGSSL